MTAIVALALLAVYAEAWARGGGGRFGAGGRGGLLEALIDPCRAECADTARACHEAADAEALACIGAACADQVAAAQAACAGERGQAACREAVSVLRECGESCLETRATAIAACREAHGECREACGTDE